jgi:3-hydroxybutyryl-CoA dehydrogenase
MLILRNLVLNMVHRLLLQSKIDKGELGRGVGKGFYDYSNGAPYLEPDFLK